MSVIGRWIWAAIFALALIVGGSVEGVPDDQPEPEIGTAMYCELDETGEAICYEDGERMEP